MQWMTRRHIRSNRMATAWLIRWFVDSDATFTFVEADEVARIEREAGAIGFDAPGARYPHRAAHLPRPAHRAGHRLMRR